MTPKQHRLDPVQSWDGEHASELALSCLADGQLEVIDADVRAHVDRCADCTLRVGSLALESHAVGAALERTHAQAHRSSHRFPSLMTAIAAALAIVCALPGLIEQLPRLLPWIFAAPRLLPLLTASLVAVAHDFGASPLGRAASVASAAALCAIGFALAQASRTNAARKA